ncbi:MAG TPA: hypothetical protein VGJ56_02560 [Reyranella sp.]
MQEIAALLSDPSAWAALATMVVLEVVIGIDNLIFISILTNKLPVADQPRARFIGMSLAMVLRLILLAGVAWIYDLIRSHPDRRRAVPDLEGDGGAARPCRG